MQEVRQLQPLCLNHCLTDWLLWYCEQVYNYNGVCDDDTQLTVQLPGSATWRRYLYLVPLEGCAGQHVDIAFVNKVKAAFSLVHYLTPNSTLNDCCLQVFNHVQDMELPYNAFAFGEHRTKGEGLLDLCTLYRAQAYNVEIPGTGCRAMCVELVGNRFLRRMVRLLVGTSVREAMKPLCDRDVSVIEQICKSGDRATTAFPFPGAGLAFAGCGFHHRKLACFKFIGKEGKARVNEYFERSDTKD